MPDYRRKRSERSRAAILAVTREAMGRGIFRPSGPAVAKAAGVAIRTLWLHFKTIESLYLEAIDEETAWKIEHLVLNCSHDLYDEPVMRLARTVVLGRVPVSEAQ